MELTPPQTAAGRFPMEISRPRNRPRETPQLAIEPAGPTAPTPPPPAKHPADPRSHWVPGSSQTNIIQLPTVPTEEIPSTWSPHLHPDRRVEHPRRRKWEAPSLTGSVEWAFGRRNVQVYAFCLGFLIPLSMSSHPCIISPEHLLTVSSVDNCLSSAPASEASRTLRRRL